MGALGRWHRTLDCFCVNRGIDLNLPLAKRVAIRQKSLGLFSAAKIPSKAEVLKLLEKTRNGGLIDA